MFRIDRVSVNNGEMLHINRFMDVGKTDREGDGVNSAPGYALTGHIPEDLKERSIIRANTRISEEYSWSAMAGFLYQCSLLKGSAGLPHRKET